jgi:hypothetical protein
MTIFTSGSKALGVLRSMTVVLALSLPGVALAAVPSSMAVHGGLFAAGGGAVSDGNYFMTFSLYQAAVGGNPVYVEGPVVVAVKGGYYQYTIGSKTLLDPAVVVALATPYLGIKIGADPELARQPMGALPYALRAATADGLDCSGCISVGHLDAAVLAPYAKAATLAKAATTGAYADLAGTPDLSPYAKIAGLAKVATSGAFADVAGTPDLSAYAKSGDLAKVATSGKYADVAEVPDLTGYAAKADLAKVATTGAYADLADLPTHVALGVGCGTGLVVMGIKEDGSLDCAQAMVGLLPAASLPPDGLGAISNGILQNVGGTLKVADNFSAAGNLTITGNLIVSKPIKGVPTATYRWGMWDTYLNCNDWFWGNNASLFGGVNPSNWAESMANAAAMSSDKNVLAALFNRKGYARSAANVVAEQFQIGGNYSQAARFAGTLMRVRNSTGSAISWTVKYVYTSYSGWSNQASVALNGVNVWQSGNDCGNGCEQSVVLAIPANRTSTVIFVSSNGPGNRGNVMVMLGFRHPTLILPDGLEYVDDLETATNGWDN